MPAPYLKVIEKSENGAYNTNMQLADASAPVSLVDVLNGIITQVNVNSAAIEAIGGDADPAA